MNQVSDEPMARARRAVAARIRELVRLSVSTELDVDALTRLDAAIAGLTRALAGHADHPASMRDYVGDPVEGLGNPLAPPLSDIHDIADGSRARVVFDIQYQGAPGRAHGGWVSAVLDQVVGRASARVGRPAMTGTLEVVYHRATPLHEPLDVEAVVRGVDGRKVYVDARISSGEVVTASASAIMVTVPELADHARGPAQA